MQLDLAVLESGQTALTADTIQMYRMAADVVNQTIAATANLCQPGASVAQLCNFGDVHMTELLGTMYNRGQVEKGMAFPTCISVNGCVGKFSPLLSDATALAAGDLVKIQLGVQIDGHCIMGAQTIFVGVPADMPVTGRPADVVCATTMAAEAVLRLMRPGTKSRLITRVVEAVASQFDCRPVQGTYTCNTQRFVREGRKIALNGSRPEDPDPEEFIIQDSEAYHVNIVLSTGTGKTHEREARPTIFQRNLDQLYSLRMKTSRAAYKEITDRFPTMPFPLRALDPKTGPLGVKECITHGLLTEYPVTYEKQGELVAQVQFTVLVTEAKTTQLNGLPPPFVQSQYSIVDPELLRILALSPKTGISGMM